MPCTEGSPHRFETLTLKKEKWTNVIISEGVVKKVNEDDMRYLLKVFLPIGRPTVPVLSPYLVNIFFFNTVPLSFCFPLILPTLLLTTFLLSRYDLTNYVNSPRLF